MGEIRESDNIWNKEMFIRINKTNKKVSTCWPEISFGLKEKVQRIYYYYFVIKSKEEVVFCTDSIGKSRNTMIRRDVSILLYSV